MSTDLETQLAAFASYLDQAAAPVQLDEMSSARAGNDDWSTLERDAPHALELESGNQLGLVARRRRTRVLAVAGVTAAAAAIAGLLVITNRETPETPVQPLETSAPEPSPSATPATPATPTTVAPATFETDTTSIATAPLNTPATASDTTPATSSSVAASAAETTSTSPAPVTNSSVVTSDPLTAQLTEIAAAVNQAHSTFDSFAGTVTVRTGRSPAGGGEVTFEPDTVNNFVLRNDGSLWSSGGSLLWSSYDASTGIARNESVDEAGVHRYQQVVGWSDNSVPLGVGVGLDPVLTINATAVGVTSVDEVDEGGRSAWKITYGFSNASPNGQTAGFTSEDVYILDKATGLVLRYVQTQTDNGSVSVFERVLQNIELGAALPPEFPGEFPPGASVDVSGNPDGFQKLDLAGAIAQFGSHVVIPPDVSSQARFRVETIPLAGEDGQPVSNWVTLYIDIPSGFAKSQIVIRTEVPVEGAPLRPGTIVIDGLLCQSVDGTTCATAGDSSLITAGALAGRPATIQTNGITIHDGPISIFVSAPTQDAWEAMANSLERVAG